MNPRSIRSMHAQQLYQLTGCKYAVLVELTRKLKQLLPLRPLGRPPKFSIWTQLLVTLAKLRGEQAYRSMEVFFCISFVTIHRYTNKISELLAGMPLFTSLAPHQFLIVDGTCTRIRSSSMDDYSGYKHHKNKKVQLLIHDKRQVLAVSVGYSGKVHDKTMWNKEFTAITKLLDRPVLSDKAYAGAKGEPNAKGKIVLRPIKRNEVNYKLDKESCKAFNRQLSQIRAGVEHVFAQLKSFKILRNLFPLQPKRYATCFKAVALVYNMNLQEKNSQK